MRFETRAAAEEFFAAIMPNHSSHEVTRWVQEKIQDGSILLRPKNISVETWPGIKKAKGSIATTECPLCQEKIGLGRRYAWSTRYGYCHWDCIVNERS